MFAYSVSRLLTATAAVNTVFVARCDRYLFKSGNADHPGDRFYNTTVEALPMNDVPNQQQHKYAKSADGSNFLIIGEFGSSIGERVFANCCWSVCVWLCGGAFDCLLSIVSCLYR